MSFGRLGSLGRGFGRLGGGAKAASGAPVVSTASLDFITDTYSGTTASVARLLAANKINTDGSLSSVSANTKRLSAVEFANIASGLLIEGATTNGIPNSDFTGAANGVVGSGGSLPTGWTWTGVGGVTLTVSGAGTSALGFVIGGTNAGGATGVSIAMAPSSTSGIATNGAETRTLSFWMKQVATSGLLGLGTVLNEANAAGSVINGGFAVFTLTDTTGDIGFPFQRVYTTQALTRFVRPTLDFTINTGAQNISYTIERVQDEASAFRTVFQAGVRNADVVTVANASTYIGSAPWTMDISWRHPRKNGTYTLAEAKLDANNRIELYSSGDVLKVKVVSASSTLTDTTIGRLSILTTSHVALSVSGSAIAASLNGKTAKTASLTPPSGLTSLQLGGGTSGYIYSTIGTVGLTTTAKTAGEVATLSAVGVGFFDDFDRANGAPGTSPTGHVYTRTPTTEGTQIVLAAITSNKLVAADSGQASTAAYTTVDMVTKPRIMSVGADFTNASLGGTIVFITSAANMQSLANLTCSHLQHASDTDIIGYFDAGSNTNFQTETWAGLTLDGSTLGNWASILQADGSTVTLRPDGSAIRSVNGTVDAKRGRYATFEHFWTGSGDTRPELQAISSEL